MILDLVHDTQKAYRKVLKCMSRPGVIENISELSEKVDIIISFYSSTLVLMLMLLDAEVSFKVIGELEDEITSLINQLTYAKASSMEKADFILILRDAKPEQIEEAFRNSRLGDLIDPHMSATIVIETTGISNESELTLKGPGIEKFNYAKVNIEGNWALERARKNIEYPLGVDVIFIDSASNIVCLPRTTQILEQVVK